MPGQIPLAYDRFPIFHDGRVPIAMDAAIADLSTASTSNATNPSRVVTNGPDTVRLSDGGTADSFEQLMILLMANLNQEDYATAESLIEQVLAGTDDTATDDTATDSEATRAGFSGPTPKIGANLIPVAAKIAQDAAMRRHVAAGVARKTISDHANLLSRFPDAARMHIVG